MPKLVAEFQKKSVNKGEVKKPPPTKAAKKSKASVAKPLTTKSEKKTKKAKKTEVKKKVSSVGKKFQVLSGTRLRTSGGLKMDDLTKNAWGRVVSKKKHKIGLDNKWIKALMKARKKLGVTGFVAIQKDSLLYQKAMKLYK